MDRGLSFCEALMNNKLHRKRIIKDQLSYHLLVHFFFLLNECFSNALSG